MATQSSGLVQTRLYASLREFVRSAFLGDPNGKTYALVSGAVILWASWPALATLVHPAPPFLVLGFSALVGFAFSFALAARKTDRGVLFGKMGHPCLCRVRSDG